jgi:hypothetical protein
LTTVRILNASGRLLVVVVPGAVTDTLADSGLEKTVEKAVAHAGVGRW